MSEGDVSAIHDEDVLRRMWQQTEDFSRKKEIRAHMYRLREQRLRSLYSPEPSEAKGRLTSSQGHTKSFADQTFQSMKSKEVRDAGSPPKEFTYRGQDLKALSNAGWNVQSDTRTTDDGRTHVRSVDADIAGKYDVEGGKGQFAAVDHHKQAVTEYNDDNTSLKRNESSSNTAANEQVFRKTDDGSTFSSETSSSTTTSKFQQVSSTKQESVPYISDDVDVSRQSSSFKQSDSNIKDTSHSYVSKKDFEQNLRNDNSNTKIEGELTSRKVVYPDENTKLVIETRAMPDGSTVTSTRREIKSSRAEQQSQSESKSYTSKSSQIKESSSNIIKDSNDIRTHNVKEVRGHIDTTAHSNHQNIDRKETVTGSEAHHQKTKTTDQTNIKINYEDTRSDCHNIDIDIENYINKTRNVKENIESTRDNAAKPKPVLVDEPTYDKTYNDQYQTTYQSDYNQKRVSQDLSPTHQAWASSLRGDTPTSTRPTTRASSPGSRTYQSSTSSLRSSVSPDKTFRKPSSRGGSPNKIDSYITSDSYSSHTVKETASTKRASPERPGVYRHSISPSRRSLSPDRKFHGGSRQRPSVSPDKKSQDNINKPSISPERKTANKKPNDAHNLTSQSSRPGAQRSSPERKPAGIVSRPSQSPERRPGYQKPTFNSNIHSRPSPGNFPLGTNSKTPSPHSSPDRSVPHYQFDLDAELTNISAHDNNYQYVDEETKVSSTFNKKSHNIENIHHNSRDKSEKSNIQSYSTVRKSPVKDHSTNLPSSLRKESPTRRSPSPPKGPVTFETDVRSATKQMETTDSQKYQHVSKINESKTETRSSSIQDKNTSEYVKTPVKSLSPPNYGTYDKNNKYTDNIDHNVNSKTPHGKPEEYTTHKKSSRSSLSPAKTPTAKDSKYMDTTDFIRREKTTQEYNTKIRNERPRQLVTPSTSPTRKAKVVDKAPSTGQSSPTTSVSEIVYFSSPRQSEHIVTDLDEYYCNENVKNEEITRDIYSENLFKRSPSPSKIPCRSPSPDKRISPTESNLPRKSSLKKPSSEFIQLSPSESPPTTFQVSPVNESKTFLEHKVVKKDRPDKVDEPNITTKRKEKPPLERRETYEERCRKILGMTGEEITSDTKSETLIKNVNNDKLHSPSISPCNSPFREPSPNKDFIVGRNTENELSEFIRRETGDSKTRVTTQGVKDSKTPSRENSPAKLQNIISDTNNTINLKNSSINYDETTKKDIKIKSLSSKEIVSPVLSQAPSEPWAGHDKKIKSPTHSRTPSPNKKVDRNIQVNDKFIVTEKDQEIINKAHNSLRKLSPDRNKISPTREKSPSKIKTSLHDLDLNSTQESTKSNEESISSTKETFKVNQAETVTEKTKNSKITCKSTSRNVSPSKKSTGSNSYNKSEPISRSISPRKHTQNSPVNHNRAESPQTHNRKPQSNLSNSDKIISDTKKTGTVTKQNSFTKTVTSKSTTYKIQDKTQTSTINKTGNKPIVSQTDIGLKKDIKVTRTSSDFLLKNKKPSPQRIKSKPEIHVNDVSDTKTVKQSAIKSTQKSGIKEPTKLTTKPKSATALNTTNDEDYIITDVQQAKSSRENSPERICPTPIGFLDDVGKPRLPDEVSEPDDDIIKRNHHTIHETESIVDDIVEISEDEELFARRTDVNRITESDECLLSVTDKVSKFSTTPNSYTKAKNASSLFKNIENNVHSDFVNKNIKSDDCLLSVSEKVTKFTNVTDDPKATSRNTVQDEYDTTSTYQDNYTKLSVNDKTNLFVESIEDAVAPTKSKGAQKKERPDFSNVEEALKTDDCLLSVSDKVNKFIKTAEQFLSETQDVENKSKKVTKTTETHLSDNNRIRESENDINSFAKETVSSHAKVKDYISPNLKVAEHTAPTKTTTLRSCDSVKKAKALFENIATSQQPEEKPLTTKLTDIGVVKKSPRTDSTTVLHPSIEDGLPNLTSTKSEVKTSHEKENVQTFTNNYSRSHHESKSRTSPTRLNTNLPATTHSRQMSPSRAKSSTPRADSPKRRKEAVDTHLKDDTKIDGTYEVSSRRGSGKFGVELKRTSLERSTISNERRRSSTDHHQPCIEDIFDLDLLEQMLEKVVGYEQRRRIRAQIRIAKKITENEHNARTNTFTKNSTDYKQSVTYTNTKSKSPNRCNVQTPKNYSTVTNGYSKEQIIINNKVNDKTRRPHSPEKSSKNAPKTRSPTRHLSPDKKLRSGSPTKISIPSKPKPNRFNEYASAYMQKAGLNDRNKPATLDTKAKKTATEVQDQTTYEIKQSSSIASSSLTENLTSKDTKEIVSIKARRTPSPEKPQELDRTPQSSRIYQRSPSPDFKRSVADSSKVKKETIIKTVYDIDDKVKTKQVQESKPSWITSRNLKKVTSETKNITNKKVNNEKKYRAPSPSKIISKPIDVITSSYGPGPMDADGRPLFGIKALRNGATNYQVKGTVVREEFHSRNGGEPEGTVSVTAYSNNSEDLLKLLRTQDERPSRLHGLAAITTTKKFGGDTGTTFKDVHSKEERAMMEQFTHSDRKSENKNTFDVEDSSKRGSNVRIKEIRDHKAEDRKSKERVDTKRIEEKKTVNKRSEERKTVRQSSVKSLTEKYIKNATDAPKSDRSAYPKAGLILRTATLKDSISSETSAHGQDLLRTDSERSINSMEGGVYTETRTSSSRTATAGNDSTTTTRETRHTSQRGGVSSQTASEETRTKTTNSEGADRTERSFLDSSTMVSGVQDILARMKNADIVIEQGDTTEDAEARALLNKFLGATVLMAGMQSYVDERQGGRAATKPAKQQETRKSSQPREVDIDNCWDERVLRKLLEECRDYEQRRSIRARIRALMAEQEACASAVAAALGDAEESVEARDEEVTTVTSSVRRNSSEKTISSSTTTKTTKAMESTTRQAPKNVSPFAKFRQLEKQNSTTNPSSPKTPQSPGSPSQPFFKFTDPALACSAITIKERLLQWCRDKTRSYENVKLENFSTSWSDGLAFCALVHHFLPDAFDYSKLTADKRRHNFTLAFKVADEKAGIYPLLDVDDMVAMRKPDWKCVFTYVQAIYRRFKDQD